MTHIYQPMLLKKIVFTVGLFLSSFVGVFGDNSLNTNSLLKSISDVETGGQYWRIGGAGERSQYQIRGDVWRKYSTVPFWKASSRDYQSEARRVAICYIGEISQGLATDGVEISSRTIALRWNAGVNRVRFLRRHLSYASRVANLYEQYSRMDVTETMTDDDVQNPIRISLSLDDPAVTFVSPTPPATMPRIIIFDDESFVPPVVATM